MSLRSMRLLRPVGPRNDRAFNFGSWVLDFGFTFPKPDTRTKNCRAGMTEKVDKQTKKKFLEGIGCLLYIAAAVILIAVFLAHCDSVFQ